jgi:hypothetical protein
MFPPSRRKAGWADAGEMASCGGAGREEFASTSIRQKPAKGSHRGKAPRTGEAALLFTRGVDEAVSATFATRGRTADESRHLLPDARERQG